VTNHATNKRGVKETNFVTQWGQNPPDNPIAVNKYYYYYYYYYYVSAAGGRGRSLSPAREA
jgi:hypothetical protein